MGKLKLIFPRSSKLKSQFLLKPALRAGKLKSQFGFKPALRAGKLKSHPFGCSPPAALANVSFSFPCPKVCKHVNLLPTKNV